MASTSKVDKMITAFIDAFDAALEYARPHWDQYARLYQLWRTKRFYELEATYSKINLCLFHSTVQDRLPKLYENIFSTERFFSVQGDNPLAELSAKQAEAFMLDLMRDKIKVHSTIWPTLQTVLIGGTAYRMPHVTYVKQGDTMVPRLASKDLDFFQVLPAPGGGHVNPICGNEYPAVPWVMVVDWWTEDKIKALAERGILDKEGVRRLLAQKGTNNFEEEAYRDRFATVGNLQYTGADYYRKHMGDIGDKSASRRIVHWLRRDKHIIIGEDWVVLYEGESDGVIPIAKYIVCPDQNNWFGISYLQIQEDLIKAMVMNFNLRMDNLIQAMFPTTYIRQDLADHGRYKASDFEPKPYDVKFFPASFKNENIANAIFVDRREEITPQTFMDEDRMKAFQQKVSGMTETTQSLGDVIGNKTATGVTSILAEMSGRPNMESTILEYSGVREELMLLLRLAARNITGPTPIRARDAKDGFRWSTIDPDDLANDFTVVTRGTRYLAEKNQNFQKMMAMYPLWNQSPAWDQYELARQSAEIADVLPDIDAALVQPDAMAMAGGAGSPGLPGGMASAQDMTQRTRSVQNRTAPEPRTGRITTASRAAR